MEAAAAAAAAAALTVNQSTENPVNKDLEENVQCMALHVDRRQPYEDMLKKQLSELGRVPQGFSEFNAEKVD